MAGHINHVTKPKKKKRLPKGKGKRKKVTTAGMFIQAKG